MFLYATSTGNTLDTISTGETCTCKAERFLRGGAFHSMVVARAICFQERFFAQSSGVASRVCYSETGSIFGLKLTSNRGLVQHSILVTWEALAVSWRIE